MEEMAEAIGLTSVLIIVTTVTVFFYFVYNHLINPETWEKYGVKQAYVGLMEPSAMAEKVLREHGDTVGVTRPLMFLITRDLALLKNVLVKDFNCFSDRWYKIVSTSPASRGVFFLDGADWKRIRQLMSPSFSTGKLKQFSSHIQTSALHLADAVQACARADTLVKVRHLAGQYATSIIARTAFGLHTDCIGEENDDQFTYSAKNMFKLRTTLGRLLIVALLRFPTLHNFIVNTLRIPFIDEALPSTRDYLNAVLEHAIADRERAEQEDSGACHNDFLQSLVSVKVAAQTVQEENIKLTKGRSTLKKIITKQEIMNQSVFLILAAFETTTTTFQFMLYFLAKHPNIQEKAYREIRQVVKSEEPTHKELAELGYVEQVINETLRLYPPVPHITRNALETRTYGNITIPVGSTVLVPIRDVHRDPKVYPDPETFDPDRFSEANKATRDPMSFMPFGWGPRLCIGMRLAYLELKIGLVQVLRRVSLELNENTVPRIGEEATVIYRGFPQVDPAIEVCAKLRH
ncbi:cytochrome P450 3A24 [Elysia marginata]|uniref:Cytochrome P450 3A24 n=1 Tax=Elysia marginata TaxID=1093978 RepID=A0AAV4GB13_9GAST|nr:cytochrome P450 3A24 [Elysia marginata]